MAWASILGSALGFGATLAPEFVSMLRDHFEHRRDMESRQLANANEGWITAVHEQEQVIAQQAKLIESLATLKPEPVVDTDSDVLILLKTSVRPLLTYGFFLLFAVVKLISVWHAYHVEHLSTVTAVPVLWDDETETLFSAVISFWFGSRLKGMRNGNSQPSPAKEDELTGTANVIGE